VILFVDALGWNILQKALEHKDARALRGLIDEGVLSKITSMFPSTTSAHVPAFHTGLTPGETGVFEWFQYAAGIGRSIRPLQACYAPSRNLGELAKKFDLSTYCPTSTYFDELSSIGVKSYCYYASHIADGAANQLMCKGAEIVEFDSIAGGLADVATLLKSTEDKQYIFFYFDGVDHLAHVHGPYAEPTIKVAAKFWKAFNDQLLPTLQDTPDTLLLVTADHGQIEVDPTQTIKLESIIPEVLEMQRLGDDNQAIFPGGSPRDLFLYLEPEKIQEALAICKDRLDNVADVYLAEDLMNAGLFGPVTDKLRANMGDIVILPYAPCPIFWAGPNDMYLRGYRGQHGGLNREEAETIMIARCF
jgi:predicted AlkP superfamily pyrophosphatase or phosphodiesterase